LVIFFFKNPKFSFADQNFSAVLFFQNLLKIFDTRNNRFHTGVRV
jgi:hypothetical protein